MHDDITEELAYEVSQPISEILPSQEEYDFALDPSTRVYDDDSLEMNRRMRIRAGRFADPFYRFEIWFSSKLHDLRRAIAEFV